jgi:predicted porin
LLSTLTFAYQDSDIDGVEDHRDKCPNSSFDEVVDENGCTPSQHYFGTLTLLVGSDIILDDESQTTNFNVFANYRYNDWDITLSNANNTASTSSNSLSSAYGDLYLSTGYYLQNRTFTTKLSLGIKLPTTDEERDIDTGLKHGKAHEDTGTGENDLFASLYLNYGMTQRQNLYLYYRYTISGESQDVEYRDFSTYSIGSGYAFTPHWYSALSYDHSGSPYPHDEPYRAISWFNSYAFSKRFFATINYAHGLNDTSPNNTISLKLGVRFE